MHAVTIARISLAIRAMIPRMWAAYRTGDESPWIGAPGAKLWVVLLLVACASGGGASKHLSPGNPDAAPALSVLPEMAQGISGRTDRTHQGMLMARKILGTPLPTPPADRSNAVLQKWVDTDVVKWLEQRRKSVDDTRFQFTLSSEQTAGERIVTHAVIGLLHEDTALSLERIPPPKELESEPEIAQMFRDILRSQATPFVTSALVEFRECSDTAFDGPDDMRNWAQYCAARFERLKAR